METIVNHSSRHKESRQHGVDSRRGEKGFPLHAVYCLLPANKKGFSLIEMMIALAILAISMLGLLNIVITSIRVNLQNDIRNTAIRLTTQTAEILLAQPMNSPSLSTTCTTTTPCNLTPYGTTNAALQDPTGSTANYYLYYPNPVQTMRGTTQSYTVTWSVTDLTTDLKEISITVLYSYPGQTQSYTNSAVIHKHKAV
ncbi:MAG: prepilin-type N-terminal cleavage/methylation domain-containing protein [Deltaproteobacteria bacterium]|nr:prepilin-type N-terminal cleavage/methylation domain-containing protein [Deltaproteobacteria bacterium]